MKTTLAQTRRKTPFSNALGKGRGWVRKGHIRDVNHSHIGQIPAIT